uniref:ATP synthase F0 subunit 8 n=1 Tax=Rhyacophila nubila TaxID=1876001 RepID=A0A7D7AT85_9NEOP|nr:ATP synthase F0 subunit 8 [Rhyacophila nubila]
MPQMMPMNWLLLFFFFISMLILMNMMTYYMSTPLMFKLKTSYNYLSSNKPNWNW